MKPRAGRARAKSPRTGRLTGIGEQTVGSFVDVIISAPDGVVYGAQAAGEMISAAPEVAGAAVEGAGEIAGAVFETVAAIIGGIFS